MGASQLLSQKKWDSLIYFIVWACGDCWGLLCCDEDCWGLLNEDCWGLLNEDCWGLLGLLGLLRIAGVEDCWDCQDCWGLLGLRIAGIAEDCWCWGLLRIVEDCCAFWGLLRIVEDCWGLLRTKKVRTYQTCNPAWMWLSSFYHSYFKKSTLWIKVWLAFIDFCFQSDREQGGGEPSDGHWC